MATLSRKLRWEPRRRDRASALPGEEGKPSAPDKRGRADLQISQHLSAKICTARANLSSGSKVSTNTAATGKDEPS